MSKAPIDRSWPRAVGLLAVLALAGVLVGCSSGGTVATSDPSGQPTPASSRVQQVTPTPGTPGTPGEPTPAELPSGKRDAIWGDLAGRGVPTDAVQVISLRAVTWPDGSWGCGEPGRSYTQALVPGMEIIVAVDGARYDYHFGSGDTPRLCTRPHATISANPNA